MGTFIFSLFSAMFVAGILLKLRRTRRQRAIAEAKRAFLGRLHNCNTRHELRARVGKTKIVPSDLMSMREQWAFAERLKMEGLIEVRFAEGSQPIVRIKEEEVYLVLTPHGSETLKEMRKRAATANPAPLRD